MTGFVFVGFCRAEGCHAEGTGLGGFCGRHGNRYFPPGECCAWCGADLKDEPERCWNLRAEAFCRPNHRNASNRALRRLRESIERESGR